MERTILGTVHGDRIDLREPTGLADGQTVEVIVRPAAPGDGLHRTAGALADDPDWDSVMEAVQAARRIDRPGPMPGP